jgi:hypothetical protein
LHQHAHLASQFPFGLPQPSPTESAGPLYPSLKEESELEHNGAKAGEGGRLANGLKRGFEDTSTALLSDLKRKRLSEADGTCSRSFSNDIHF